MDKWAIRPDPAPHDPKRHLLLLKGTMVDVSLILRKFGAMCGRPKEILATPEGFNYSLALHGVTPGGLERLGAELGRMAPGGGPATATLTPPVQMLPPQPTPISEQAPPPELPPLSMPPALDAPLAAPPTLGGFEPPAPGGLPALGGIEPPSLGGAAPLPALGDAPAAPALAGFAPPDLPPLPPLPGLGGLAPAEPPSLGGLQPVESLPPPAEQPVALGGLQSVETLPPPSDPSALKAPEMPALPPLPTAPAEPPVPSGGLQPVETLPPPSDPSSLKAPEPPAATPPPDAVTPATVMLAPPPTNPPPPTGVPTPVPLAPPATLAPPPVEQGPPTYVEPAAAPAAPAPTPAPAAAPPAPAPAIAAGVVQAQTAIVARPLWGLHQTLDAGHTFESLLVGAYNRFAHAAATSVVSAPGTMYNPLFLYGAPGAGKTHICQSISRSLSLSLGEGNVIVTTGSRLSGAVSAALAEKRYPELEEIFQKAKALVVDDIHLLAVTEANRSTLAQIFAIFFGKNLQVVLTSIYPPRALGALEEALKISFGKGWSVDVKIPNPTVQVEIVRSCTDRMGLNLSTDDARRFHEMLGPNYFEASRWALRLKRFVKLGAALGRNPAPADLFAVLFDPGVKVAAEEMPNAGELQAAGGYKPPPPGPDAKNIAFLVPKGGEALTAWALMRFFQTGAELGVTQTYRPVLVEAYDAQQPFGVPFQIGELCLRGGAQAAVIVGPPPDTQLAARESEFAHAVGRILDGLDVPMGWIKYKGTTALPHYLRAHLDLLKGFD